MFRTQAHCIRDEMTTMVKEHEKDGSKPPIYQEMRKRPKNVKFLMIDRIETAEDIVSLNDHITGGTVGFDVIIVSLCRAIGDNNDPGEIDWSQSKVLNEPTVFELIKSKCRKRLIIIGHEETYAGSDATNVWQKVVQNL